MAAGLGETQAGAPPAARNGSKTPRTRRQWRRGGQLSRGPERACSRGQQLEGALRGPGSRPMATHLLGSQNREEKIAAHVPRSPAVLGIQRAGIFFFLKIK